MPAATTDWAFARYEAVRHRMPTATFPAESIPAASLEDMAGDVDAFVLDAFGVLNVGTTAIPGAAARLSRLRAMGKRLLVLTNGATLSRQAALAKYHRMGFDFTAEEVVSSRDVTAAALATMPAGLWAAASGPAPDFGDIAVPLADLLADDGLFDRADGIVLLSSLGWTDAHQARLTAALQSRPRPLLVGNPDLVAPHEHGFSLEPGHFAHRLADEAGVAPVFFGKPYADAYAVVRTRLEGIAPSRIAAVGDTLHTDILGGAAAGLRTVLVTGHGLYAGHDVAPYVEASGIVADWVMPTI